MHTTTDSPVFVELRLGADDRQPRRLSYAAFCDLKVAQWSEYDVRFHVLDDQGGRIYLSDAGAARALVAVALNRQVHIAAAVAM